MSMIKLKAIFSSLKCGIIIKNSTCELTKSLTKGHGFQKLFFKKKALENVITTHSAWSYGKAYRTYGDTDLDKAECVN